MHVFLAGIGRQHDDIVHVGARVSGVSMRARRLVLAALLHEMIAGT
jgi:hypothetical protein